MTGQEPDNETLHETPRSAPARTAGIRTVIHPVSDLERAKRVFGLLAEDPPYIDESYYVGYRVAAGDLAQEIGLDPHGHRDGAVAYWHVPDLRERLAALVAAGAQLLQDVSDVGGGKLVACVRDADGNLIGLLQE